MGAGFREEVGAINLQLPFGNMATTKIRQLDTFYFPVRLILSRLSKLGLKSDCVHRAASCPQQSVDILCCLHLVSTTPKAKAFIFTCSVRLFLHLTKTGCRKSNMLSPNLKLLGRSCRESARDQAVPVPVEKNRWGAAVKLQRMMMSCQSLSFLVSGSGPKCVLYMHCTAPLLHVSRFLMARFWLLYYSAPLSLAPLFARQQ